MIVPEAQLKQEQAAMHEQGMADDQLIGDHEREDFAGTSAVPDADVSSRGHSRVHQCL